MATLFIAVENSPSRTITKIFIKEEEALNFQKTAKTPYGCYGFDIETHQIDDHDVAKLCKLIWG